ncbi:63 kDa globulin-like protein [Camellia lanceoleosa]|uniref:63 kDa globulin-like protein n=1 Tax=Camellia lanceoleosa TaxID=1840588 RepID=A0ACC0FH24_9ERIC|nr:63 kDa globulin-like protein [Camellia lanceoleosa]
MSSLVLFGVRWQRQQQRKARGQRIALAKNAEQSYEWLRPSRGVVFIVPPGHPVITIASKNQNLQIVCFDVNALNNEKFPLAGLLATFFGLKLSIVFVKYYHCMCGLTQSNYKELNILYEKYKDQVPLFFQSWILMIMSLARWNQIIDAWIDGV